MSDLEQNEEEVINPVVEVQNCLRKTKTQTNKSKTNLDLQANPVISLRSMKKTIIKKTVFYCHQYHDTET